MRVVRRLNERGIVQFRSYLQRIREGLEFKPIPAILFDDEFSPRVMPVLPIDPRKFVSKLDAAAYLRDVLAPIDGPSITADVGLWSWLALYYFEQLAPANDAGLRRPREDYHYIPSSDGWRRDRHLLAEPYTLYMLHGDRARLLLYPAVHEHGQFIYDLGFRREFITNRGLIEAMDMLYWDTNRSRPKRGTTTRSRRGNLRRLITVLQQLDFNYDLYGMTAREIIALLPSEFDEWKPAPTLFAPARTAQGAPA